MTDIGVGNWKSINNGGAVAGEAVIDGLDIPVVRKRGVLIPPSQIRDRAATADKINNLGLALGSDGRRSAILWGADGVTRPLSLPAGARPWQLITPIDLNDAGVIAAQVRDETFGGGWGSGLWSGTRFLRKLYGNVAAVNSSGDTVGTLRSGRPGSMVETAYLQAATGAVTIIGSPEAPGRISVINSFAIDVNDSGLVLLDRYLWRIGRFTNLGAFVGKRLNNEAQIAGNVSGAAAVWFDGIATGLGPVLSGIAGVASSWAVDINDAGQVLVRVERTDGKAQGVILTPVPTALVGTVASASSISLKKNSRSVSTLTVGHYAMTIRDKTASCNFHLVGPGVNKKTDVTTKKTAIWKILLRRGTYSYFCDGHSSSRKGTFKVVQ